jgi:hypothetical protein
VKNIPLAKSNALKGINSPANDFKSLVVLAGQNFNPFMNFRI